MSIPTENLRSVESQNPFREEANAVVSGTGWEDWRRNWYPLFVIVLPALIGVLLMVAGQLWIQSTISAIGGVLYLSSYYVAAIWTGLGRKTLTRMLIDWSIPMLILFSLFAGQIAIGSGREMRMEIVQTGILFGAFCLVNSVLVPVFLLFRGESWFFLPGDGRDERITIADLLTITAIVATCLGIIRGSHALMPGAFAVGDIRPPMPGLLAQVIVTFLYYVVAAGFFGMILGLILGMPLLLFARFCWRKSEVGTMTVCLVVQIHVALFCCIALPVVIGVVEDELVALVFLPIGLAAIQAIVFLILASLISLRFPQGDLVGKKRFGK